MSRADNWMPLYVADYLRDTTHLSAEQHGAYLLLIMGAWTRGGVLPADDGQLSAIARLPLPAWRKAKGVVMAFFTACDGGWEHKRVRAELERAQSLSNKRREASEKRWQTPSKTDAIASATDDATTILGISPTGVAPPSPLPPPSEVSVVADAPSAHDGDDRDPDAEAWSLAVSLLTKRAALSERQARTFFAGLLKRHSLRASEIYVALAHAEDSGTPDLQPYLTAAAQNARQGARHDHRPSPGHDRLSAIARAMHEGISDGDLGGASADALAH